MELTPEIMYWVTRLDYINKTLNVITIVSGIIGFISGFLWVYLTMQDEDEKVIKASKQVTITLILTFIISGLAFIFVPTTKDMAVIYGIPTLANQGEKAFDTFGKDAEEAIKAWLKKQAEE